MPQRGFLQSQKNEKDGRSASCVPVPYLTPEPRRRLGAVIHVELHRMGGHAEARQLVLLEGDVSLEDVVVEHTALGEEGVVLLQAIERFLERSADMRHLRR